MLNRRTLFAPLRRWHYARQRKIDLEILWPILKSKAPDLLQAKFAFSWHCHQDPAWQSLGEDKIDRQLNELT